MNLLQQLTGLDRGIDPRLPSNLFALIVTLSVGVVIAVQGGSIPLIIASAGWVFTSWALGRELDPDRPLTAALASSAVLVALLAFPEARGSAAVTATLVLMLCARAGLNSTGRALKIGDELLIATAPVIAQLLTGLPLSVLGISSLAALYLRRGAWWSMAVAGLGVAAVFFAPARDGAALMFLALLTIGGLSFVRRAPTSQSDNGGRYDPRAWRVMQVGIWAGAALAALLSPPLIWGSLAVTGVLALILERLPVKS